MTTACMWLPAGTIAPPHTTIVKLLPTLPLWSTTKGGIINSCKIHEGTIGKDGSEKGEELPITAIGLLMRNVFTGR